MRRKFGVIKFCVCAYFLQWKVQSVVRVFMPIKAQTLRYILLFKQIENGMQKTVKNNFILYTPSSYMLQNRVDICVTWQIKARYLRYIWIFNTKKQLVKNGQKTLKSFQNRLFLCIKNSNFSRKLYAKIKTTFSTTF
jgi:hypothetical protein